MSDYLEKVCSELSIRVAYTQDNATVLSSEIEDSTPIINVHNKFKECSEDLAKAIVEFFTGTENNVRNLRLILDYINENLESANCSIIQPDNAFMDLVKDLNSTSYEIYETNNKEHNLKEYKISQMTMNNFFGESIPINSGQSITASCEDVIELDIFVDDGSN